MLRRRWCALSTEIILDALTLFPSAKLKQRDALLARRRIHLPTSRHQCHIPVYPAAIVTHPSQRKVTCIYLQVQTGDCSQLLSTNSRVLFWGITPDAGTSAENDDFPSSFHSYGVDLWDPHPGCGHSTSQPGPKTHQGRKES